MIFFLFTFSSIRNCWMRVRIKKVFFRRIKYMLVLVVKPSSTLFIYTFTIIIILYTTILANRIEHYYSVNACEFVCVLYSTFSYEFGSFYWTFNIPNPVSLISNKWNGKMNSTTFYYCVRSNKRSSSKFYYKESLYTSACNQLKISMKILLETFLPLDDKIWQIKIRQKEKQHTQTLYKKSEVSISISLIFQLKVLPSTNSTFQLTISTLPYISTIFNANKYLCNKRCEKKKQQNNKQYHI